MLPETTAVCFRLPEARFIIQRLIDIVKYNAEARVQIFLKYWGKLVIDASVQPVAVGIPQIGRPCSRVKSNSCATMMLLAMRAWVACLPEFHSGIIRLCEHGFW